MKPQLYNINAFDGAKDKTFYFLWNGNQSFGNVIQIRNNQTNEIIYQDTESTMQLKHSLPANTLKNGLLYNIRIAVIDIDNNISEYSDPVLFYCYTTPTLIFDNISSNQIIKNSAYQIYASYKQIENEPLESWEISLYNTSKSKINSSGVQYTYDIKYMLTDLEDNQNYYIKASCMTLNGMEVETEFIPFSVNYKQPAVYSILTLENIKNNGYIKLQSNIRAVEAHSKNNVKYVNNEYVDLIDNSIYIDDDFSMDDDFSINLVGYNLVSNQYIMKLSDGKNMLSLYLRKGLYDINNNIEKTYVELKVPVAFTNYICFSNYIDNPKDSDKLSIWIKRKDGLYSVYIENKGGE